MGLIKEPKGIDLIVGPSIVTEQDKKMISKIIANYKKTRKTPSTQTGASNTNKLSGIKNAVNG